MTLLDTRKQYNVSQIEVASMLKMPVRTYIRYEQNDFYGSALKREMMIQRIVEQYEITETKGLLDFKTIKEAVAAIVESKYKGKVAFVYLFGSYAKGYAKEDSDIDLLVDTDLTGLSFVGLGEAFRSLLHKKIDLIRFNNIDSNLDLIREVMKDGIKIYG